MDSGGMRYIFFFFVKNGKGVRAWAHSQFLYLIAPKNTLIFCPVYFIKSYLLRKWDDNLIRIFRKWDWKMYNDSTFLSISIAEGKNINVSNLKPVDYLDAPDFTKYKQQQNTHNPFPVYLEWDYLKKPFSLFLPLRH